MLKRRLFTSITAALLLFSLRAQAETEALSSDAIVIDSDKLELHFDRKLHAIGNASIRRGKQTILGDEINYDMQNDNLHVIGNVKIDLGDARLSGPELKMRLSDSIGEMRDASIVIVKESPMQLKRRAQIAAQAPNNFQAQKIPKASTSTATESTTQILAAQINESSSIFSSNSNDENSTHLPEQSRGDAKVIFFDGQDKKRLQDARFTTCSSGTDDWYIKAKELAINEFTESAVGKNAYIEFKKIPILYTPSISFSYSGQRKSGFLSPFFGGTTSTGFELSAPYYWNIAPNMDATLTAREMSNRGLQLQGE
ncbi:MAG: hypothetical protein RLZZ379_345, partial [Pseudomonadota bacterium]